MWSEVHSLTVDMCKILVYRLIIIMSLCVFRVHGCHKSYHSCTPGKDFGSFFGEMSGTVHNVSFMQIDVQLSRANKA